jgi:replicative DNA helicase
MVKYLPEKLPSDVQSENTLIATLGAEGMLDRESGLENAHQALALMKACFFADPRNARVFKAIKALYDRGEWINLNSIKSEMELQKTLDSIGGVSVLVEMLSLSESGKPTFEAKSILEKWQSRETMVFCAKTILQIESCEPIDDIFKSLQSALTELIMENNNSGAICAEEILRKAKEGQQFRENKNASKLVYLGIHQWDKEIEAAPGHLIIISARPGVGKTALAIQGAWITASNGIPNILISLEMDQYEVESRLASWQTHTASSAFRDGSYTSDAVVALSKSVDILKRIHYWCHSSGISFAKIEGQIRNAVFNGIKTVWIDYFTLIGKPNMGKNTNDAAAWGHISTGLKRIAQELKICIVLISQLNRDSDGSEPKLSDLRETGQLEQDANAVVMLWADAKGETENKGITRVIKGKIAKNRSGSSGIKLNIDFKGAFNVFEVNEDENKKKL